MGLVLITIYMFFLIEYLIERFAEQSEYTTSPL